MIDVSKKIQMRLDFEVVLYMYPDIDAFLWDFSKLDFFQPDS